MSAWITLLLLTCAAGRISVDRTTAAAGAALCMPTAFRTKSCANAASVSVDREKIHVPAAAGPAAG
jgi:hypothetical protein